VNRLDERSWRVGSYFGVALFAVGLAAAVFALFAAGLWPIGVTAAILLLLSLAGVLDGLEPRRRSPSEEREAADSPAIWAPGDPEPREVDAEHRVSSSLATPTARTPAELATPREATAAMTESATGPGETEMTEEIEVGRVSDYFARIGVAGIELTGELRVGDAIHIKGATTDLTIATTKPVTHQGVWSRKSTIAIKDNTAVTVMKAAARAHSARMICVCGMWCSGSKA
jgi:hypothetical protein